MPNLSALGLTCLQGSRYFGLGKLPGPNAELVTLQSSKSI